MRVPEGDAEKDPAASTAAATAAEQPRTPPRRVLFVDHARAMGGAETSLLILMRHLDARRYRPVLASQPGGLMDRAQDAGIEVAAVEMPRLRGRWSAPIDLARGTAALYALAREQACSIIHANVLRASLYAAPAARLSGLPLVWHVRDILPPGRLTRSLCAASQATIAISKAVARPLPCRDRAQVIYNPVEAPSAAARSREALGLPERARLVASVGRLRRWKGHHRLIEVAAEICAREPDLHFLIIGGRIFVEDDGDADYPEALRRLAAQKGLQDRVHLLGQRDDLEAIWPHLSALVHLGDAEPFGRVVAEAQMAGVPAIGFDEGGLPEIIEEGVTGYLLPKGDLAGVTRALARLLADPATAGALSAKARERARLRFDAAAHARSVEAVYDSLLSSQRPGEA